MFTVSAEASILERLAAILKEEGPGMCVRLREYVIGGG